MINAKEIFIKSQKHCSQSGFVWQMLAEDKHRNNFIWKVVFMKKESELL